MLCVGVLDGQLILGFASPLCTWSCWVSWLGPLLEHTINCVQYTHSLCYQRLSCARTFLFERRKVKKERASKYFIVEKRANPRCLYLAPDPSTKMMSWNGLGPRGYKSRYTVNHGPSKIPASTLREVEYATSIFCVIWSPAWRGVSGGGKWCVRKAQVLLLLRHPKQYVKISGHVPRWVPTP